jgi:dihydrofolate reductase
MRAILACDKHGGIGYRGTMPWPKQVKDLTRFKELTTGATVIMGRGTWEATGMPKPLPNRKNIVVSRQDLDLPADVYQIKDLTTADLSGVDWCIGGASLLATLWDTITEIHLSRIRQEYVCDTFIDIPALRKDFICVSSQICLTHTYEIWSRNERTF